MTVYKAANLAGKTAYPIGGETNTTIVRAQPTMSSAIISKATLPNALGVLTGEWTNASDGNWLVVRTPGGLTGWTREDVMRVDYSSGTSATGTQSPVLPQNAEPTQAGSNALMWVGGAFVVGMLWRKLRKKQS